MGNRILHPRRSRSSMHATAGGGHPAHGRAPQPILHTARSRRSDWSCSVLASAAGGPGLRLCPPMGVDLQSELIWGVDGDGQGLDGAACSAWHREDDSGWVRESSTFAWPCARNPAPTSSISSPDRPKFCRLTRRTLVIAANGLFVVRDG